MRSLPESFNVTALDNTDGDTVAVQDSFGKQYRRLSRIGLEGETLEHQILDDSEETGQITDDGTLQVFKVLRRADVAAVMEVMGRRIWEEPLKPLSGIWYETHSD